MDEWIKKLWNTYTVEKEGNPAICVNTDVPGGHYAK
jgi:hypothetical protein